MIINVVIANDDTPMSIAEIYLKSSIVSFLKFPSFSFHVYRMMRELNKWIFFRALYLSPPSLSFLSLSLSLSLFPFSCIFNSLPLYQNIINTVFSFYMVYQNNRLENEPHNWWIEYSTKIVFTYWHILYRHTSL